MSTMHVWLDETEIDWSPPPASRPARARRPRRRRGGASPGRGRLAVVAIAIGALASAPALSLALADLGSGASAPAPPPIAPPASGPSTASPPAQAPVTLEAIAHCESRGDATAVSADGRYRGKYQFDLATWRSVGGTGDPARASEREQDRRAHALAAQRGTQPWPVCGPAAAAG